ncbi:MAG TPA: heme o synthase [Acidobacteriaceae bacterium]|nr:heme o synthase [Acidobacteriaceae bacterium]
MRSSVKSAQSNLAHQTAPAVAIHAVTPESESIAALDTAVVKAKAIPAATRTWKSFATDTIATFKLRVTTLVVMTAWAGYYLGAARSGINSVNPTLLDLLIGVALVSCGASALNQAEERRTDALMIRTANRPLAAGRLSLGYGVFIGMAAIIAGSLWLVARTNPITGTLTLLTAVTYVGIYTPLKRYTSMATFIGAFPGAMPPLIGWTAARGTIEWPAVALFAILFIWQFPHFMSIAWLYREDYKRAGIRMLPVVQPDGWSTAAEALVYAILMIPVSLAPYYLHMAGRVYWVSAMLLGLLYLAYTIRFARITKSSASQSRLYARALLKVSVIYLPLLLTMLMLNATRRN